MDAPVALIVVAVLAAGALLLRDPRRRAASLLAAVVVDALLVIAEALDADQLQPLRDDAALGLGVAAAVVAAVAAVAWGLRRRPSALPILAAVALPFRVPIEAGGSVTGLLVPLLLVAVAGALAYAIPRLRSTSAADDGWSDAAPPAGAISPPGPRAMAGDDWSDAADASPRRGAVAWLLALSLVLYAVQSTYGADAHRALHAVAFFFVPGVVLFALLTRVAWTPRLARRTLAALAGVAVALAVVAVAERAARHVLVLPDVVAATQDGSAMRIGSAFFDPELFGRFLVAAMLGIAAVLLRATRRRTVLLAVLALAVLLAGVVVTLSNASLAALLIGLLVLAAVRWRARWAIGAGVLAAAGVVALVALSPGTLHVDHGRCVAAADGAAAGRCSLARSGLEVFEERPARGFGAGTFVPAYREQRHLGEAQARRAARSAPVVVAVEQGVPGLVVLAALAIAGLATLLRRLDGDPMRAAVGAAFAAVLVHAAAAGALLDDPLTWALLGAGVALDRAAARHRHHRRRHRTPAPPAEPRPAVPA